MKEKRCGRCGISKRLSAFNRRSDAKDGRQGYCRLCHRRRTRIGMRALRDSATYRKAEVRYAHARYHSDEEYRRKKLVRQRSKHALADGRIQAEARCADCACGQVEMHHPDYDNPLDVVWLCRPCHLKRHHAEAEEA